MEGNRRITLFEPAATEGQPQGPYGDVADAAPTEYVRWALRRDRGGQEEVAQGAAIGEWNARFEVRTLGIEDISQKWWLRDQDGREYDIVAIAEAHPADPRRRKWWIYCTARG